MPIRKKPKQPRRAKPAPRVPYSPSEMDRRDYMVHQWGMVADSAIPVFQNVIESQVFLNTHSTEREAELVAKRLAPYIWNLILSLLEKESKREFKR